MRGIAPGQPHDQSHLCTRRSLPRKTASLSALIAGDSGGLLAYPRDGADRLAYRHMSRALSPVGVGIDGRWHFFEISETDGVSVVSPSSSFRVLLKIWGEGII